MLVTHARVRPSKALRFTRCVKWNALKDFIVFVILSPNLLGWNYEQNLNFFPFRHLRQWKTHKAVIKLFHSCLYVLFSLRPAPDMAVLFLPLKYPNSLSHFLMICNYRDVIITYFSPSPPLPYFSFYRLSPRPYRTLNNKVYLTLQVCLLRWFIRK